MSLAGMAFGQWLALAAGAAALTVALYLLRPRQRRVLVPFAPLWQAALGDAHRTRLHRRLRHLWSLLLSLVIVLALVAAIGDPRFDAGEPGAQTLLLVDCSASMGVRDGDLTRLQRAVAHARRVIDGRGAGDHLLVASLADRVTPLSPVTRDEGVLRSALAQLALTEREADLPAALSFASDVLSGAERPQLVVITDGSVRRSADGTPAPRPERAFGIPVRYLDVGGDGDNLAVTALSARRQPLAADRSALLVEVANASERAHRAELTLSSAGRVLATETLELGPGARVARHFEELSGIDERVEARVRMLDGEDLLALDDVARATLPPRRRGRILAVTRGNLYLQAALLLDPYLSVTVVEPEAYSSGEGYDFIVFDDHVPPEPPRRPALYLHPEPAEGGDFPFAIEGRVERPFIERVERDAPLLRHLALGDVNIAEALDVRLQPGDEVLAGDRGRPLIVEGERIGVPFVALTFDPRRSDLPLRAAWPLLLLNVVDHFQPPEVRHVDTHRVGHPASLPVEDPAAARVYGPDGQEVAAEARDGALRFTPSRAGFYTLKQGERAQTVAVQLPPEFNHALRPQPPWPDPAPPVPTAAPRSRLADTPWRLLTVLCLLLLSVEWWTFHRRWTA